MVRWCSRILSADDVQIYLTVPPDQLAAAIEMVQEDLESIHSWAIEHCLRLNPDKNEAIIFGSARYLNALCLQEVPVLTIGSRPIRWVQEVRSLGVTLSPTLSWNSHTRGSVHG